MMDVIECDTMISRIVGDSLIDLLRVQLISHGIGSRIHLQYE
jgi:hypothetical protein